MAEGARKEIRGLRGRHIGVIQMRGDLLKSRDPAGRLRGHYHPHWNQARSPEGRLVAPRTVLATMLLCRVDLLVADDPAGTEGNCAAATASGTAIRKASRYE